MRELDESFSTLLGRQPTDKEKQALYRVRDALKLKATDAVWLLLMALQHYETLYGEFPARIAVAAQEVTAAVRSTALAEARAAQETTKRALMAAVQEAAVKSSAKAAGANLAKWVTVGCGVICFSLLMVGWRAFHQGRETGRAVGEQAAKRECRALAAASSWVNTPEGRLAYEFSKAGGLDQAARCTGRGMVARDGWCVVASERGRPLARWPLPVSETNNTGVNR